MRIYDITMPLSTDLPVYPGDVPVSISPWTSIASGDAANLTRLTLCTHSGTHLDAPRHFNDQGLTVDNVPLSLLIGKVTVVEILGVRSIGRKELERLPVRGAERLLLKTDNSLLWKTGGFTPDYAAVTQEGAGYLLEAGVRLVGIDYLSVERFEGSGDVHRTLLDNGVLILEGLNLAGVPRGEYELICLPLKVQGGDGAPARALLRGGSETAGEPEFDPHSTKWPLA
jgi:arylformamidase